MSRIYLEFKGNGTAFDPHMAQLILGDHAFDKEKNEHYLSPRCSHIAELEIWVEGLKREFDEAVAKAKKKFSN